MNATFKIDVQRPVKVFDQIADKASKPDPILKRWGGYFIATARKRADAAEGWPGLSAATREKLEQTRTSSVTVAGEIRKSYGVKLDSYLRLQQAKGAAPLSAIERLRELHEL